MRRLSLGLCSLLFASSALTENFCDLAGPEAPPEQFIEIASGPLDFQAGPSGEAMNIYPLSVTANTPFDRQGNIPVCVQILSTDSELITEVRAQPGDRINLRTDEIGTMFLNLEPKGNMEVDTDGRAHGVVRVAFVFTPGTVSESAIALPAFLNQANKARRSGVSVVTFSLETGQTTATAGDNIGALLRGIGKEEIER